MENEEETQHVAEENRGIDSNLLGVINVEESETIVIDLCATPSTSTSTSTQKPMTSPQSSSTSTGVQSGSVETNESGAEGNILECPICLQSCIHPARLPCGHIFCFLCVKGVAYKNRRCAMCRREIPPEFLDHPQLVNGIDDICTTKSTEDGYQWFYEGRNGWWQYDDRTSQDIEEAYKKGEKSCTVMVAGYVYIVDLVNMLQLRQNDATRCRRVKRDLATIPKKGVAGLRIEGNTVTTDFNFASQVNQGRERNLDLNEDAALDLGPPLGMRLPPNASDFISTIAATDAAIRIASDIIGSTLAHADEFSRGVAASSSNNADNSSGENSISSNGLVSASVPVTASGVAHGSRELLDAAEDLLDATQSVISGADQETIEFFEQTLNDFHFLTLRNIINSSDEDEDGSYAHRHIRF
ncbi:E3 ubiquitin-protein ligase rnf146 isoform X2 [Teleopsis dalmanni]|nr:E3 ubiquitin-protein ligase rnf146 isoform X2 [Teleopsis dalmanni]